MPPLSGNDAKYLHAVSDELLRSAMPTPTRSVTEVKHLLFSGAIDAVLNGEQVRRQSWPADVFTMLANGVVCIRKPIDETKPAADHWDGLLHPMTFNDGDLTGDDWYVIMRT